jgi:hypothetical protein
MATKIFIKDGVLNFNAGSLASATDYETADRCAGSIFEALEEGEIITLQEGLFELDEDLDLVEWMGVGHQQQEYRTALAEILMNL